MKTVSFVLSVLLVLGQPLAAFGEGVAFDLSSTTKSLTAEAAGRIKVGKEKTDINVGDLLTPAELAALNQVLTSRRQTLRVNDLGAAVGGRLNLVKDIPVDLASLLIPKHVTAFADMSKLGQLDLTGNLSNFGSLMAFSTAVSTNTAFLSADNIFNQSSGLISTVLSGNPFGAGRIVPGLNLDLTAAVDIINSGIIRSAGALTMTAGGQIVNALPNGAVGGVPLMQAFGNINLDTANLVNTGLILSTAGNINVISNQNNILVNNVSGILNATKGNINVRDALFTGPGNIYLFGGQWLSKEVNLYAGDGEIYADVNTINGKLNSQAGLSHVYTHGGTLRLGDTCVTGDPTYANTGGDIVIDGTVEVNEKLAILASGAIYADPNAEIITNGNDLYMVAGAMVTLSAGTGGDNASDVTLPPAGSANPLSVGQTATVDFTQAGTNSQFASIDLYSSQKQWVIDTSATTTDGNGGNVTLAAYGSNSNNGSIVMPYLDNVGGGIKTTGDGTGNGGNVTLISGSNGFFAVEVSSIDTRGGAGGGTDGNVGIYGSQPKAVTGTSVTFDHTGAITAGDGITFTNVWTQANAEIDVGGTINAGDGDVTIKSRDEVYLYGEINANNIDVTAPGYISITGGVHALNNVTVASDDDVIEVIPYFVNGVQELPGEITAGNDITITSGGGDLFLNTITATNTVTLQTSGNGFIFYDNDDSLLTANKLVASSANDGIYLLTKINQLEASSTGSDVYIYNVGASVTLVGTNTSGSYFEVYADNITINPGAFPQAGNIYFDATGGTIALADDAIQTVGGNFPGMTLFADTITWPSQATDNLLLTSNNAPGRGGYFEIELTGDQTIGDVAGGFVFQSSGLYPGSLDFITDGNLLVDPAAIDIVATGGNVDGYSLYLAGNTVAKLGGGTLVLNADGQGAGYGGNIGIEFFAASPPTVTIGPGEDFDLSAASAGFYGGNISFSTNGDLIVDPAGIDVSGDGNGGSIYLTAKSLELLDPLSSNGGSGSGGRISIRLTGTGDATIGALQSGQPNYFDLSTVGQNGGYISVEILGDLFVDTNFAQFSPTGFNGQGGTIVLEGNRVLAASGPTLVVNADGTGTGGGGQIRITQLGNDDVLVDLAVNGGQFQLSANSGLLGGGGGFIAVSTGGDLTVNPAAVTSNPLASTGSGGGIALTAGEGGDGNLLVTGPLLRNGKGDSFSGGSIRLESNSLDTFLVSPLATTNGVLGTLSALGKGGSGSLEIENEGGSVDVSIPLINFDSLRVESDADVLVNALMGGKQTQQIQIFAEGSILAATPKIALVAQKLNTSPQIDLGAETGSISSQFAMPLTTKALYLYLTAPNGTVNVSNLAKLPVNLSNSSANVFILKTNSALEGSATLEAPTIVLTNTKGGIGVQNTFNIIATSLTVNAKKGVVNLRNRGGDPLALQDSIIGQVNLFLDNIGDPQTFTGGDLDITGTFGTTKTTMTLYAAGNINDAGGILVAKNLALDADDDIGLPAVVNVNSLYLAAEGDSINLLNFAPKVILNNVRAWDGNLMVATGPDTSSLIVQGSTDLLSSATIQATNGSVTLLQNNALKGIIIVGFSADIFTNGSSGGNVNICVATVTQQGGPAPLLNVNSSQTGGTIYWGANSIIGTAPNNFVEAKGADVWFFTNGRPASTIQLKGDVFIQADPPVTGVPTISFTAPSSVASSAAQLSGLSGQRAPSPMVPFPTGTPLEAPTALPTMLAVVGQPLVPSDVTRHDLDVNKLDADVTTVNSDDREQSPTDQPETTVNKPVSYHGLAARFSAPKLRSVGCNDQSWLSGETLVDTETTINAQWKLARINAKKNALLHTSMKNGNLHVKACGKPGEVSVSVGGKTIALHPGQEIIVSDHDPMDRDLKPADGIGRRRFETHKIADDLHITLCDFSMLSLMSELKSRNVFESNHGRKVYNAMLKTTAAVETIGRVHGAYTAKPRIHDTTPVETVASK